MDTLPEHYDETNAVLKEVRAERYRQDALKRQGKFPFTCADGELSDIEKLAILMEEVGEAATACMHLRGYGTSTDKPQNLRKELIQVAAVCVAWLEFLNHQDLKGVF